MVIIGGLGSIFGSFAGAAFLVLLPVLLKNLLVGGSGLANRFSAAFVFHYCRWVNYYFPYFRTAWLSSVMAGSKRKIKTLAVPSLGWLYKSGQYLSIDHNKYRNNLREEIYR